MTMIEAGKTYPCCVCTNGTVEIPLDADQETLDEMSIALSDCTDTCKGFVCSECVEAGQASH